MTAAEFFEYLASRSDSRALSAELLTVWAGVRPLRSDPAPAACERKAS